MNEVGEKYLPIGTVVMLKGGTKRVMITGFCSMPTEDQSTIYDYSGCMFPEGFLSSDQTALFNHSQIEKVYHMGLVDDEETQFKTQLKVLADQLASQSSDNTTEPTQEEKKDDGKVDVMSVPPVGPGLPGYVAPQTTEATTNNQAPSNDLQFDENGVVVAEYKFDEDKEN